MKYALEKMTHALTGISFGNHFPQQSSFGRGRWGSLYK